MHKTLNADLSLTFHTTAVVESESAAEGSTMTRTMRAKFHLRPLYVGHCVCGFLISLLLILSHLL